MTFDKNRVYTALNADESLIGAKGYFAESLCGLIRLFESDYPPEHKIQCIEYDCIIADDCDVQFQFFYLVEPAPEKWYVYKNINGVYGLCNFKPKEAEIVFKGAKAAAEVYYEKHSKPNKWFVYKYSNGSYSKPIEYLLENNELVFTGFSKKECERWVSEHSKPKYRPFKSTEELISYFCQKHSIPKIDWGMPFIWVKNKKCSEKYLIIAMTDNIVVLYTCGQTFDMQELFENYTFLDGSVCGVEE